MIVYLDTSAFVKLMLEEAGAEVVRAWFGEGWPAVSSVVTYPEACSALGRRARERGGAEQLATWINELEIRWRRILAIRVDPERAGRLALRHRLRGMDAVQLAASLTARERLRVAGAEEELRFAAFDQRLLEAAAREGFATLGGPLA